MEKKRYSILVVFILCVIAMLSPGAPAATVGHGAQVISEGVFESGNYTFPDSLFIEKYFNVSDKFWVSPDGLVGIGTTSPAYTLQVEGTTNTTSLRVEGLSHFLSNVTMDDNLTVGGNKFFVDSSSGNVGIGTTGPNRLLELSADPTGGAPNGIRLSYSVGPTTWYGEWVQTYIGAGNGFRYDFNIKDQSGGTTGGAAMSIYQDGNVGIGTTTPSKTLEVVGTAAVGDLNTTSLTTADLAHFLSNVTMDDNLTVGGNALYVDSSSGNVGIGTTSPGAKLEITNTTAATTIFNVSDGNDVIIVNATGTDFDSGTMYVDKINNYVGIGTTAPGVPLDIKAIFSNDEILKIYDSSGNRAGLGIESSGNNFGLGFWMSETKLMNLETNGGLLIGSTFVGFDAPANGLAVQGRVGIGTVTPSSILHLNVSDSNTATATDMLTLEHVNASGAVSAGIGSAIIFKTIDSASDVENISMISGILENVANGTERGALVFYTGYGDQDGIISNLSSSETMRLNTEGLRINGNLTVTGASYLGSMIFDTNATFGDSVNISEDLEAGGILFVDGKYGNVGIGTTNPAYKLDIYGDVNATAYLMNDTSCTNGLITDANGLIYCSTTPTFNDISINATHNADNTTLTNMINDKTPQWGWTNTTGLVYTTQSSDLVHIGGNVSMADNLTVGGNALYVDSSSGNVGIGTTGPTNKFEVNIDGSTSNVYINAADDNSPRIGTTFGADSYIELYNAATGAMTFRTNSVNYPFIFSLGSVGIGTVTPSSILHLNVSDSNTATATDMLTLEHVNASGAVSAGIGSAIMFKTTDSASDVENVSMIAGILENVANGSERGALLFYTGYGDQDGIISNLSLSETMRLDTEGLRIQGNLTVTGATLLGSMSFDGNATFTDSINVSEDLEAGGTLFVDGKYGNVGIGTTTPGSALDVYTIGNGDIRIFRGDNPANYISIGGYWIKNYGGTFYVTSDSGDLYLTAGTGKDIRFRTGADDMTIKPSGYIGIGTTTPSMLLDVNGDTNLTGVTYIGNSTLYVSGSSVGIGTTSPAYTLQVEGTTNTTSLRVEGLSHFLSNVTMDDNLTVGGNKFFVDSSSGNVGIGNTNPQALFHLYSAGAITKEILQNPLNSGYGILEFDNDNGQAGTIMQLGSAVSAYGGVNSFNIVNVQNAPLSLGTNNQIWMTILGNGNVGIGTTAPAAKLEVAGSGSENLLNITDGDTNALYIDSTGNASINSVTALTHNFNVEGTVNMTRGAGQAAGIEVDGLGNVIIRLG